MRSSILSLLLVGCCCVSAFAAPEEAVRIGDQHLQPRQPQLAAGAKQSVHLVFGSGKEIYYCASKDQGASFNHPKKVAGPMEFSIGMRRGPRIAASASSIIVTAIGGEHGGGKDGDVLAWESTDDGNTWRGPARVNDVEGSAREGLHAMAAGPDGQMYCVWLDLRNKRTEIMGAAWSSRDKSWTQNWLIYQTPDGSVCECCHPSVTYCDDGSLVVMWRNSLSGNRDMYYATSTDGGESFGNATKLGTGTWQLKACPMDGGAIAARNSTDVCSVWRRDKTVYLTSGEGKQEVKLGDGEQPWLALAASGPLPVWVDRRGGDLLMKLPGESIATHLASDARDPVCIALGDLAVVAWESGDKQQPTVYVRRIGLKPEVSKEARLRSGK